MFPVRTKTVGKSIFSQDENLAKLKTTSITRRIFDANIICAELS